MNTPAEEWSAATAISQNLMLRPAGPFAVLALTTIALRALEASSVLHVTDPLLVVAAMVGLPLLYLWTQIEQNAHKRIRDLMAIGAPVRARLFLRAQLMMLAATVILPAAIVAHDTRQWFEYLAVFVLIAGLGSRGTGAVLVAGIVLGLAARYGVAEWLLTHLPLGLWLSLATVFGVSLLIQQIARIRRFEVWSQLVVHAARDHERATQLTQAIESVDARHPPAPDVTAERGALGDIERLDLAGRVDYVMGWPAQWPSRRAVVFYLFALPVFVLGARFVFGQHDAAVTLISGIFAVILVVAARVREALRGLIEASPRYACLSMAPAMPDRLVLSRAWLRRALSRVALDALLVGLGFTLTAVVVRQAPVDVGLAEYLGEIAWWVVQAVVLGASFLLIALSLRAGEWMILPLVVLILPLYALATHFHWLPWPLPLTVPLLLALILGGRLYRRGLALPYGPY